MKKITASIQKVKNTKRNKYKAIHKFKYNMVTKHPAYIHSKQNDKYLYVSLTHAKQTKNKKNIPLKQNPNPKDKKQSFVLPQKKITTNNKTFNKKSYNSWKFCNEDKKLINKIIKKNKKEDRPVIKITTDKTIKIKSYIQLSSLLLYTKIKKSQ